MNALTIRIRVEARARKYGLTLEDLDELIKAQDRRCAICAQQFSRIAILVRSALFIDHSHTGRGTVRGLLCRRCNSGIGFFDDDPDRLREAARYVEFPIAPVVLRRPLPVIPPEVELASPAEWLNPEGDQQGALT